MSGQKLDFLLLLGLLLWVIASAGYHVRRRLDVQPRAQFAHVLAHVLLEVDVQEERRARRLPQNPRQPHAIEVEQFT